MTSSVQESDDRPDEMKSAQPGPLKLGNPVLPAIPRSLSSIARCDLLALPDEPVWLCDWKQVVFLHFEVDPVALQRQVPFALDLFDGRAFVSLVAFTLADLRPRRGGWLTRWLCQPFGTHRFLNLRAYVRQRDRAGIFFLAEWLDAPRLNRIAGPRLYGLPFEWGALDYTFDITNGRVAGSVHNRGGRFDYQAVVLGPAQETGSGSLDEFLVERYRAFCSRSGLTAWFPVWHPPWRIAPLDASIGSWSLLKSRFEWLASATCHSAHGATGAGGVWMGWRRRC